MIFFMKNLYDYLTESVLDNIEDTLSDENAIKEGIIDFIKNHYNGGLYKWVTISDKPNKKGVYEVSYYSIVEFNGDYPTLTNGNFVWKEVGENFIAGSFRKRNNQLETLEGAPEKIKKGCMFVCSNCPKLKNLKGAPKHSGGIDCSECDNLESLEGAPKKVHTFKCARCPKLDSLKYGPMDVINFDCSDCTSLKSLEHAPKKCEREFRCYGCATEFTEEDVKAVCTMDERRGDITCIDWSKKRF